MTPKRRLSASIEAELMAAGVQAVARGEAPTLSAWVNEALRLKLDRDQRLRALARFLEEFEAEEGEITPDEMRAAARSARARAMTVRELGGRPLRKARRIGASR